MANKVFKSLLADVRKQKNNQDLDIKDLVKIEAVFRDLIPPLSQEEFSQLENNILAEGCREALLVWERQTADYVLVDGHNRYKICQKHGIYFKILMLEFEDDEQAKLYIINNQLGRRNLSSEQMSYLRGLRYLKEKAQGTRVDLTSPQNEDKLKLSQKFGREYNVGHATIERDALFAKAIDKIGEVNPELKRNILSGKTKITKSQVQELAKMENLPVLEKIEDLENLFSLPKTEKPKDELQAKKDFLVKFIKKTTDLMSLEQIEKFCLDLAKKS